MLFFQKTLTIPLTSNLSRRHSTSTRKPRKYSQDASTKKPKGGKTISWTSRILQKIWLQIRRHIKSANSLNQQDVEFKWTPECENCFQILKEFLQQAPKLRYPDPQASYTLYTDASKYAYVGILAQHNEGIDNPITYVSGLFRGSQLNWATPNERGLHNLHVSEKTKLLH